MFYIYDILQIGSEAYKITYNITKKGRVAARPFSCVLALFLYIMLYRYNIEIILVSDTGFWIPTILRNSYE